MLKRWDCRPCENCGTMHNRCNEFLAYKEDQAIMKKKYAMANDLGWNVGKVKYPRNTIKGISGGRTHK